MSPATNRWIKVKLHGVKSNRSAIGARVVATYNGHRQAQEVLAQAGFLSVNDKRLHFGVGKADKVGVEVRWPSGIAATVRRRCRQPVRDHRRNQGYCQPDTPRWYATGLT